MQTYRKEGAKLRSLKKKIQNSRHNPAAIVMSQTAIFVLTFWFDYFDRQRLSKGLGVPPVADIASACPDCKCVNNADIDYVEEKGYCCFHNQQMPNNKVFDEANNQHTTNNKALEEGKNTSSNANRDTFRYEWKVNPWGKCDRDCGVGEQRRIVECIKFGYDESVENETVNNDLCVKSNSILRKFKNKIFLKLGMGERQRDMKPAESQPCKVSSCSQWEVKQFCNRTTCTPSSNISCRIKNDKGDWIRSDDTDCTTVLKSVCTHTYIVYLTHIFKVSH